MKSMKHIALCHRIAELCNSLGLGEHTGLYDMTDDELEELYYELKEEQ